jgi:hypothetical protein
MRPAQSVASVENDSRVVPNRDDGNSPPYASGTEASMKHPSNRELFEYWNARRGARPAPERDEIEPNAIRHVLADTFILAFEPHAGHPFRVAGTRVCALFARELKGEPFLDLWSAAARTEIRELLVTVTHETIGAAVGVSAKTAEISFDLELVLLPLAFQGRPDARVLGALAPYTPPPWLGRKVPRDLALGSHRYVGGAISSKRRPILPIEGRLRRGFLVYDGGQA